MMEFPNYDARSYLAGMDAGEAIGVRRGVEWGYREGLTQANVEEYRRGWRDCEEALATVQRRAAGIAHDAADAIPYAQLCERRREPERAAVAAAFWEWLESEPSPADVLAERLGGAA